MKTRILIFVAMALSGCANTTAYQRAYQTAYITRGVVEEAHKVAWSDPLNARITKCGPEADAAPKGTQLHVFDACMEPYSATAQARVEQVLSVYHISATTLNTVLAATGPSGFDPNSLAQQAGVVARAARDLLRLFPQSRAWVGRLDAILPEGQTL